MLTVLSRLVSQKLGWIKMDAPQTTHGVGELFENGDVPFNPKGVAAKIVQRRARQ